MSESPLTREQLTLLGGPYFWQIVVTINAVATHDPTSIVWAKGGAFVLLLLFAAVMLTDIMSEATRKSGS